jgi:hypothetical protein
MRAQPKEECDKRELTSLNPLTFGGKCLKTVTYLELAVLLFG